MWYALLADLIILYLLFLDIHSVIGNLVSMLLSYHFDKNKSIQQLCSRLSISCCAKCHIVTSKPNSTRSLRLLFSNNHNTMIKSEAILRVSHFKLVLHITNQGKLVKSPWTTYRPPPHDNSGTWCRREWVGELGCYICSFRFLTLKTKMPNKVEITNGFIIPDIMQRVLKMWYYRNEY